MPAAAEQSVVYRPSLDLSMDVYGHGPGGPRPAVVLLHPGGFVSGHRSQMARIARALAARGFAAFAPSYRLIPSSLSLQLPLDEYWAAVEDVEEAVAFVREHAGSFGADPSRLATFGASAGGNLAAMAGWRRARSGDENTVAAVVSWSGPLNLYTVAEQSPMVLSAVSPHLREDRYRALLAANRDAVALASPVSYLDSGAPPSFIANGRSEVIPASVAEEAAAELARLGVSHELRLYPRGHALGFTSVALGPSIAFLERHLCC